MSQEKDVLLAQIEALSQSLGRITELLTDPAIDKMYSRPIYGKFYRAINPQGKNLEDLKEKLDADGTSLADAWQQYTVIKAEAQKISDQCLDYLGGIVVRKMELDDHTCDLAEELVKYYVERTGRDWASVMIVGQERLFDTVAQITQIIRIRFPEWDISSLPFTAQEFGQLLTTGDTIDGLNDLFLLEKRRIRRLIEMAPLDIEDLLEPDVEDKDQRLAELQEQIEAQEGAENLLAPDIKAMRQRFQAGRADDLELERYCEQQSSHLRRLFADAFATYFLGPAYIDAQLYLRLNPMHLGRDLPHKPSRERRMAFMLGTLREMNQVHKTSVHDPGPYAGELNRLQALWQETVKPIVDPDPLAATDTRFGKPYDDWFAPVYARLNIHYSRVGFTAEQWKQAQDLGDQLLDEPKGGSGMTLPVILNATWYCRVKHPDRLDDIEKKARGLYQQICRPQPTAPQAAAVQR
jgi:hypothetical protein